MEPNSPGLPGRLSASAILTLAASVGLIAGLLEAPALFFLQKGPFAGETINTFFVPRAILYVAPVFDLVFFVVIAFLTLGICRLVGLKYPDPPVIFILIFLLVFDWLSLALDRVMDPLVVVILSAGLSATLVRDCRRHSGRLVQLSQRVLPILAIALVVVGCTVELRRLRVREDNVADWPQPPRGAPNVLVVVMDTVRADHLSALGYARQTSPNLDRLATRGVLFENAISTSSWTLPAHASMLTGRYPFEHGAELLSYDGRYPTLAEEFRKRGYRTGAFSANTFFFIPQNGFGTGFLYFEGLFSSPSDALIRPFYGRQLVSLYEGASRRDLPGRKGADQINGDFLGWLRRDGTRPFFAVLNYFDAHAPYLPPAPFRNRFAARPDPGGVLNYVGDRETLETPEDIRDETDAYDGAIAFEDDQIGRLLASLGRMGLDDNTLVIVVSDHGEFLGEHGLFMHRNALFLEGIRVPMLILWPGHLPAGVRVSAPVTIAALPATLMDLLPRPGQTMFPGNSLASHWNGAAPEEEPAFVLSELVSRDANGPDGMRQRTESLLTSRWHFLFTGGQPPQLFDWLTDPHELHDLAGSPQGRQITSRMVSCVSDHRSSIRSSDCGLSTAEWANLQQSFPASAPVGTP
jgi:arylsulfatase A-like enzyme